QASIRSLALAAVAGLAMSRVKSAPLRHAVWTVLTASMLLQLAFGWLLPSLEWRVLPAAQRLAGAVAPGAPLTGWAFGIYLYLAGLLFFASRFLFALRFTHRLLRSGESCWQG